jgi:transposase-like protein
MPKISYSGYRFPPEIIHQAIWLYLRFTLSLRDVEDLLAERGIAISYETVRRWVNHFGPIIAAELRKRRPKPHAVWHLDEVYLKIDGRMVYLWRAVDAEGEVLDVLIQSKRNKHAALKLMRKLLKKYAVVPERMVTDDLRSYGAATLDLGIDHLHDRGRWSRVDDWRSGCRYRGVAVCRQLSHIAGASIRTVAPFPVAARQTGRADFPHPAFSRPIKSSLLAGRCGFAGRCRGRASHKDTRPGSGRTRCLCVPIAVATSDGFVARCICG